MGRVNAVKRAFNSGELTPRLEDRSDLPKVQAGCRRIVNGLVTAHGGVMRRPGTRYVSSVKYSWGKTRLMPFVFSAVQSYIIEAGAGYFRFYMSGGSILGGDDLPYEIASPYTEDDLASLMWTQSADRLFLFHPGHRPATLNRFGHAAWTYTEFQYIDGPYLNSNADPNVTLTPSGTTGDVTLTASSAVFNAATDVGRPVRLKHGSTWSWGYITAVSSDTSASFHVVSAATTASATSFWRLGAWYPGSWPVAGFLFQGRLWAGGAASDPSLLFGSAMQDFTAWGIGTLDTDAVEFRLLGQGANAIKAFGSVGQTLLVGAEAGLFSLSSGSDNPVISGSQANASANPESSIGAHTGMVSQRIGTQMVYVGADGRKVAAAGYRYEKGVSGGWDTDELTLFAEHITAPRISAWSYQESPEPVIWAVRSDGVLLSCTYNAPQQVLAWARHVTAGVVEDVCCIPTGTADDVWLIIRRDVGGEQVRYVERLSALFDGSTAKEDAVGSDCSLTYSGAPATNISGFVHLTGKTVAILADGVVLQPQEVGAGGSLTLRRAASKVTAGLPFTVVIEPTELDLGANEGSTQGRQRRIVRVALDLYRSSPCSIGEDESDTTLMRMGPHIVQWGVEPELFSGETRSPFPGGWRNKLQIVIAHDRPQPFHLRSATLLFKSSG